MGKGAASHPVSHHYLRQARSGAEQTNVRAACPKDKLEFKIFQPPI